MFMGTSRSGLWGGSGDTGGTTGCFGVVAVVMVVITVLPVHLDEMVVVVFLPDPM